MKKTCLAGILIAALIWSVPVYAMDNELADGTGETIQSGDFVAEILEDDTVIITEVISHQDECEGIPEEIEGYPVSGIGKGAFEYKIFEDLIIPETVTVIEEDAFCYAIAENSFSLPENVQIRDGAFSYAELPAEVTIPKGTYAGVEAFSYIYGAEDLTIEEDVVLDDECFAYAEDVTSISVGANAYLGIEAFSYCDYLESVTIDETTMLEDGVFDYCPNLDDVDVASSSGSAGSGKGSSISDISNVRIPDTLYSGPDNIEDIGQNMDTLVDWAIQIAVPDGAEAVLDGSEDIYYIYADEEGSIPYVMLKTYDYDSVDEFISDFTEYMASVYEDLEVTAEPADKEIGNKLCTEIDYGYTISGYDVIDRRIVMVVDDTTYMFASKEVPELDMMVGTMLEDVVADCVFLSEEDFVPELDELIVD